MAILVGRKVVANGGTPERLTTNSYPGATVAITAETDNTGYITVGGETGNIASLATRTGTPLDKGQTIVLPVNPAEVFLDTTVNGDGVTYTIVTR